MVEMRPPQAPCTITNLFEHQVLLHPFDAAVEFENQPFVSYSRLKLLSNRIADTLKVQPGMIVPICIDLSVELVASVLGILAAGAAYVILDPSGSLERNRYIVEEVKADIVITSAKYSGLYPGSVAVEGLLDEASSRRRNSVQDTRRHSGSFARDMQYFEPTSPAYTIFTSGTTGKPKGVVISHAAATYGINHFSLNGKSRWFLFFNP
jgi:non-ribosomal peptide synthetase component F